MNIVKKINFILTGRQKKRIVVLFIMILIGALLELLGITAILPIINIISDPNAIENTPYLKKMYDAFGIESSYVFLAYLCGLLIIIYLFKNAFLIFMRHMQNVFMFNNQYRLSVELTEYYIKQSYLFHTNHNRSEIIRNISTDSSMFFQALGAVVHLLTELTICITLVTYLLISDTVMTLVTAGVLLIYILCFLKVTRKQVQKQGKIAREYAGTMGIKLYQLFGGIKEIRVLEREKNFLNSYYRDYEKNIKYLKKYKFIDILPAPVIESVLVSGLLGVIILKVVSGSNMHNMIQTLAVFAVAAFRILPSVNRITNHLNLLTYNKTAVDEVYKTIRKARQNEFKAKGKKSAGENVLKFEDEIRIEELSFAYPGREKEVIHRINMHIPKNKSVAFIGPSGAGKTTLADILLCVLEPTEGKILCDGIDITTNIEQWHKKIGYIPQSVFLLDDTIRNNVAFGIDEKDIDDKRIEEVLEKAQLSEFVDSLEKGVNTPIGECGSRLSGGQKQRIGIARALYSNPEILVMDEATSALDNDTESAVMEAIEKFAGSKTIIIIAHRLSTIQKCDIIYEIKDGLVHVKNREEI